MVKAKVDSFLYLLCFGIMAKDLTNYFFAFLMNYSAVKVFSFSDGSSIYVFCVDFL